MEWQAVESSRIREVGYDESSEVLGIRFIRGDGYSEYHYRHVPSRVHRALLKAESIGTYFAENIKNRPDLYPFTKVDTDHPTIPAQSAVSSTRDSRAALTVEPSFHSETTALAKVDNLNPAEVFVPGYMDKLLMEIRKQALEEAEGLDISTEQKRKAIKSLAFKVVKSRTYIEGLHKAYTQAEKKRLATVDAEKRRICEILQGIEEEVRAPLTAWERKEEERVKKHADAIAKIREMKPHAYPDIQLLKDAMAFLRSVDVESFEEWTTPARQAIDETLAAFEVELDRREKLESERRELERLRAEAAKRAEEERIAQAAREAREQAEREAKQREEQAEAEKSRLEMEAKAAEQRALDAERRAQESMERAKREQEEAVEAERQRAAAEAKRLQDEADARARNKAHRDSVNAQILKALVESVNLSEESAHAVVTAISEGKIPRVTISY